MKKINVVANILKKRFSVEVDDRDYSPGWKFNEWELKGVPVRIEIGPRDLKKSQAVIVRRDTGKKAFIPVNSVAEAVKKTLEDIQRTLFKRSKRFMEENTVTVTALKQLLAAIKSKKLARCFFCGKASCEDEIKEKSGATARCICAEKGKCVLCGKEGFTTYFAKAY